MGVDIHFQKPIVRLLWIDPGEEQEISEDHESLDMVVVGSAADFADDAVEAVHRGVARVEKIRQRASGLKGVRCEVVGHFQPIHAIHKFPPADDLPHESFHRRDRSAAVPVGANGGIDTFHREEESEVQRSGNDAVKHRGRVEQHEVLIVAKKREAFPDEFLE